MNKENFIQSVMDAIPSDKVKNLEQSLGMSIPEAMSSFWDICAAFANCSVPQIQMMHEAMAYLRSPKSREHLKSARRSGQRVG